MKKSVKKALTACGAAAMMLSAAQISALQTEMSKRFPCICRPFMICRMLLW